MTIRRYGVAGLVLAVTMMTALSGCSVYMSADRQSYRGDPSVIRVGASRTAIETELGPPDSQMSMGDGGTRAVYKIDPNATPKVAKGAATGFNLVADVVTLGLWEVVAFPVELASKDVVTNYILTYGPDGKVTSLETFR